MMNYVKIVVNASFFALAYSALDQPIMKSCRVSALKLTLRLMTESEHQIRVNNLLQSDLWKNVGDELRRDDTTQGTKSPSASELEKLLNEVLNDKSLLSEEAALLAAKQGLNDIPLFMTPLGNHLGYEADEADAEEGEDCDLQ
jgi:hypothetical protein